MCQFRVTFKIISNYKNDKFIIVHQKYTQVNINVSKLKSINNNHVG